jgi:hypothetical protein
MFTKEERDAMFQELMESFRPQPPPKPTPEAKWQERCAAAKPHEAIAQQAAASAEAFARVVVEDTQEAIRRRQFAGYAYQRELDRFMEANRIIEDQYVDVAGFRELRRASAIAAKVIQIGGSNVRNRC